jgi:hypothetical protein
MSGHRSTRGARCALIVLCILGALAGCAGNKSCTKPSVYSSSSAGPPLRVPPDLSQPPENDTFEVPPGPVTSDAPPCGHYPPKVADRTTRATPPSGTKPATTAPAPATPPDQTTASPQPAPTAGASTPPARPDVPVEAPPPPVQAAPAAAPSPAATQSAVSGSLENELLELVVAWARSWSDGDFAQYLSYYAQDFDPPGDLTLEEWQTARRSRLEKRPTMTVAPETLTVVEAASDRVVVEFVQRSELEGVASSLRKGLVLVRESDAWRIQQELIVDVLSDPR